MNSAAAGELAEASTDLRREAEAHEGAGRVKSRGAELLYPGWLWRFQLQATRSQVCRKQARPTKGGWASTAQSAGQGPAVDGGCLSRPGFFGDSFS